MEWLRSVKKIRLFKYWNPPCSYHIFPNKQFSVEGIPVLKKHNFFTRIFIISQMRLKFPIPSLLDHQNMPKPIPHFSIFLKKSKSPIQKSCDTSQNFCMGFWETPALAECLRLFIFLKLASREVWGSKFMMLIERYLNPWNSLLQ